MLLHRLVKCIALHQGYQCCIEELMWCNYFRGRYTIKAYPTFLEMHGKTFDYKIPYKTILQLILLPHNDQRSMFFVVGGVAMTIDYIVTMVIYSLD